MLKYALAATVAIVAFATTAQAQHHHWRRGVPSYYGYAPYYAPYYPTYTTPYYSQYQSPTGFAPVYTNPVDVYTSQWSTPGVYSVPQYQTYVLPY